MHLIPKIIATLLVFSVILIVPEIDAQTESIPKAFQKLVKVTIDEDGSIKVLHQVANSNQPFILKFLDGTVSNLEIVDRVGRYESVEVFEGMTSLPILENQGELFVTYDLSDALVQDGDTWRMDFRYLEKTTFYVPEELEMVYVNERPVVFEENKGFVCHGCQMVLEYTFGEEPVVDEEPVVYDKDNLPDSEGVCGIWEWILSLFSMDKC